VPDTLTTPTTGATYTSKDGLKIFYRSWLPTGAPRGVVLLCHGFNSHSGQYGWLAQQLVLAGFAAYAGDMRGRGRSDGERFWVGRFSDYVDDVAGVADIARSRHPALPLFVLGHSAGGVVSAVYVLNNQDKVAGFICESFAYRVPAPPGGLTLIKLLSGVLPNMPALKLNNAHFARNPDMVRQLNADPLIANETQPLKTVAEMVRGTDILKASFGKITVPTLITHGTMDRATLPAGSRVFYRKSGARDKTLKLYDGHYHDLFADTGREKVAAETISWIAGHLA
jgi:acylglycerol lipase